MVFDHVTFNFDYLSFLVPQPPTNLKIRGGHFKLS